MPVSIHRNAHKPFTNHEVDFKEKDTIYMFSDGYYDQIGGPKKENSCRETSSSYSLKYIKNQ